MQRQNKITMSYHYMEAYLILVQFTLLCFTDTTFFFSNLKQFVEQLYQLHFPTSIIFKLCIF